MTNKIVLGTVQGDSKMGIVILGADRIIYYFDQARGKRYNPGQFIIAFLEVKSKEETLVKAIYEYSKELEDELRRTL